MAQWLKTLNTQTLYSEFKPLNSHKGRRRKSTRQSGPLTWAYEPRNIHAPVYPHHTHSKQTTKQVQDLIQITWLHLLACCLSSKLHHKVLLLDWILELKSMNRTVLICPQWWKFIILRVTGNLPGVPSAKTRTCQTGLNWWLLWVIQEITGA